MKLVEPDNVNSVPESTISAQERIANKVMIGSISARLYFRSQELWLFRQSILTTENLEALLRMTDADIRSSFVKCRAIQLPYRYKFSGVESLWSIKMNDGTYFLPNVISDLSKALEGDIKRNNEGTLFRGL
jgi:hypothetical protein